MSISLTGGDSVQLDDRVLSDFADGDIATLEFPNDIATAKAGKNGNLIFAFNETGRICEATLRILLGSADDKWLNSRLAELMAPGKLSDFILLTGVFSKRVGDGSGVISTKVYTLGGGIFKRQPGVKSNVEGNTEQSVAIYTIQFGNGAPSIQ